MPPLPAGFTAGNAIDAFIAEKLVAYQQTVKADTSGIDFYRQVWPTFESKCLECHQGAKSKGGLHLDTLAGALKGGKSDGPAVTPKDAAKSALWTRVCSTDSDERMPPKGPGLSANEKLSSNGGLRQVPRGPSSVLSRRSSRRYHPTSPSSAA